MIKSLDKEELINTSMKIILHAGNARTMMMEMFEALEEDNFSLCDEKYNLAQLEIDKAHLIQTSIVQMEANGEVIEYSPLFTHAQDILMTVQTQHILSKNIIRLYKKIQGEKK